MSSTIPKASDAPTLATITPPIGLIVILRSLFGVAFYNNTGLITVQPASLFLNMTVQSVNQTGILFSITSGRVTIGPSPIVSIQRVFDILTGSAFFSYYDSRLTIQATSVENSCLGCAVPGQFQLFLVGPARFQPPNATNLGFSWYARLFGFLYNSQTKIGLLFVIGCPIWDLNADGRIDIIDLSTVGANFGKDNIKSVMSESPDSTTGYSAAYYADLNGDGVVNIVDFSLVGSHFGTIY
jgi:hypothetical protein